MSITLSTKAACELKELLLAEGKSSGALRIWVAGGGCSGLQYGMAIDDNPADKDDQVFESEGVKIVVDALSMTYLEGADVDFVDDPAGGGFKINNPNATASCGCGSSFKTEEGAGGGCGSCGCR